MPEKLTQGNLQLEYNLSRVGADLSRGPSRHNSRAGSSISDNTFPVVGAALDLDFVNNRSFMKAFGTGNALNSGLNYTRASAANYMGPNGLLTSIGNNLMRFDYQNQITPIIRNCIPFTENYNLAFSSLTGASWTNRKMLTEDGSTGTHLANIGPNGGPFWVNQPAFLYWTTSFNVLPAGRTLLNINTFYGTFIPNIIINASGAGSVTQNASNAAVTITLQPDGSYNVTITAQGLGSPGILGAISFSLISSGTTTSYPGTPGLGMYINNLQIEIGKIATPYQPTGRYTLLPSVVPFQANTACQGYLTEPASTNYILWCRDATQSSWSNVNMIMANAQIGIDGTANATLLTANAPNATISQSVILSVQDQASSVYLKPVVLTGNVSISQDGVTYSNTTLTTGIWNRVVTSNNTSNSSLSIMIQNSGDSIVMDYAQIEPARYATMPIYTTGSTATRATDLLSLNRNWQNTFYDSNKGTWYCKAITSLNDQNAAYVGQGNLGSQAFIFVNHRTPAYSLPTGINYWNYFTTDTGNQPQHSFGSNYSQTGTPITMGFSYNNTVATVGLKGFQAINLGRYNDYNGLGGNAQTPKYAQWPATTVYLGSNGSGTYNVSERIKRFVYIPKFLDVDALTNFLNI